MTTICTYKNAEGKQVLFIQNPLVKTGHALHPVAIPSVTKIGVDLAVLPPPAEAIANLNTAA